MESSDGPLFLVDLDGTLADYHAAMKKGLEPMRAPEEEDVDWASYERRPPPHIEARMDLVKRQPGFWKGLQPVSDGFEVLHLIREVGFSLNVLTKGPKRTTQAWTEKVEWCQHYLPDVPVTVTQDKGIVYGRGLFDDYPPYLLRWLEHRPRGLCLMLDQPWNRDFSHPQVVRVLRPFLNTDNVEAVRSRLVDALRRAGD